jgi:hypothetical protein
VNCPWCDTPIEPGDELAPGSLHVDGVVRDAHRECALRSVMGGIGHLTDHYYWCKQMNDPDGGFTYRQSALLVDQWVANHGRR